MRDMLPPIFQILTGLSFMSILVISLFARRGFKPLTGRLTGAAILCCAVGFLLLSRATGSTSIGAGAEMFMAAGAAFFLAVLVLAATVFITANRAGGAEDK